MVHHPFHHNELVITEKKNTLCVRDMRTENARHHCSGTMPCPLKYLNEPNLPQEHTSQVFLIASKTNPHTHLVGDVQRVVIRRQPHVCFLLSVRSVQQHRCLSVSSNTSQRTNRINVFTLAACTSHNFFTAFLICRLFALMSTRNTSVLCSSIFFIADSVFRGLT